MLSFRVLMAVLLGCGKAFGRYLRMWWRFFTHCCARRIACLVSRLAAFRRHSKRRRVPFEMSLLPPPSYASRSSAWCFCFGAISWRSDLRVHTRGPIVCAPPAPVQGGPEFFPVCVCVCVCVVFVNTTRSLRQVGRNFQEISRDENKSSACFCPPSVVWSARFRWGAQAATSRVSPPPALWVHTLGMAASNRLRGLLAVCPGESKRRSCRPASQSVSQCSAGGVV